MSVSLEKGPMPATEGEQSSVDYAAMYKEAHPDAVEDRKKAEAMAYGMDPGETQVRSANNEAVDRAINDRPDHEINEALMDAVDGRFAADRAATKVAKAYDDGQKNKR